MSKLKLLAVAFLLSMTINVASGQTISTFVGGGTVRLPSGNFGYNALLNGPTAVAVDSSGNLYFADYAYGSGGAVVYKVTSADVITIIAGTGAQGYSGDGGAATSATFGPWIGGLAIAPSGNVYISDVYYSVVRKITVSTGIISTYAGDNKTLYGGGYCGDGGKATSACLYAPMGLYSSSTTLYIADNGNRRVRTVTAATGDIATIAGNGTQAFTGDGGAATSAELTNPFALTLDSSGNIYIGDIGLDNANCRVRKITISTGIINTVVGGSSCGYFGDGGAATSAELNLPKGLAFDSNGYLYIADSGNNRIRKVESGTISTFAGDGTQGFSGDGGSPTAAELNTPEGITITGSTYYIADTNNLRIRRVQ